MLIFKFSHLQRMAELLVRLNYERWSHEKIKIQKITLWDLFIFKTPCWGSNPQLGGQGQRPEESWNHEVKGYH